MKGYVAPGSCPISYTPCSVSIYIDMCQLNCVEVVNCSSLRDRAQMLAAMHEAPLPQTFCCTQGGCLPHKEACPL